MTKTRQWCPMCSRAKFGLKDVLRQIEEQDYQKYLRKIPDATLRNVAKVHEMREAGESWPNIDKYFQTHVNYEKNSVRRLYQRYKKMITFVISELSFRARRRMKKEEDDRLDKEHDISELSFRARRRMKKEEDDRLDKEHDGSQ